MKATFKDLELEKWLRLRESGQLTWTTRDGKVIPIKDLDNSHLDNILKMMREKDAEMDMFFDIAIDDDDLYPGCR